MLKRSFLYLFLMLATASLLTLGCTRGGEDDNAPKSAAKQQSTLQTVADGITGRHAVRAGQKAQEQIREIAEQRNKDLEQF